MSRSLTTSTSSVLKMLKINHPNAQNCQSSPTKRTASIPNATAKKDLEAKQSTVKKTVKLLKMNSSNTKKANDLNYLMEVNVIELDFNSELTKTSSFNSSSSSSSSSSSKSSSTTSIVDQKKQNKQNKQNNKSWTTQEIQNLATGTLKYTTCSTSNVTKIDWNAVSDFIGRDRSSNACKSKSYALSKQKGTSKKRKKDSEFNLPDLWTSKLLPYYNKQRRYYFSPTGQRFSSFEDVKPFLNGDAEEKAKPKKKIKPTKPKKVKTSSTSTKNSTKNTSHGTTANLKKNKQGDWIYKCPHCPNHPPYAGASGLWYHMKKSHSVETRPYQKVKSTKTSKTKTKERQSIKSSNSGTAITGSTSTSSSTSSSSPKETSIELIQYSVGERIEANYLGSIYPSGWHPCDVVDVHSNGTLDIKYLGSNFEEFKKLPTLVRKLVLFESMIVLSNNRGQESKFILPNGWKQGQGTKTTFLSPDGTRQFDTLDKVQRFLGLVPLKEVTLLKNPIKNPNTVMPDQTKRNSPHPTFEGSDNTTVIDTFVINVNALIADYIGTDMDIATDETKWGNIEKWDGAIDNDAIHVDHFSFFDSDLIENLRASEEQQSTEQQPKEEPTKK